jgi:hypothetical protein
MSDDASKKVLEWLTKEGFPVEVRVGKTCRAHGWLTFHEFPYNDPLEGKLRNCDVHASRFKRVHGSGTVSVDLAIECKRSADKPWVVFAEPRKTYDWYIPPMLAPGRVSEVALSLLLGDPDPLEFLRPQDWVGYSVVKAHTSPKDGDPGGAYSALRSAVSAAEAFALRCEQEFEEHRDWPPSVAITFPVVVVGAPLYLYTLDDQNKEHLERIPFAKVVAPQRRFESRCLLTVVAEDSFSDWLVQFAKWADSALEALAPKAYAIPKLVAENRRAEELLS